MESVFTSQTVDYRDGSGLRVAPNRVGNLHRSFELRPSSGALLGGGGGGAGLLFGPAWSNPYSILYSNTSDLAFHARPQHLQSPLLPLPPLPLSKSYDGSVKAISYPPPNKSKTTWKPNKSPASSSSASSASSSPLILKRASPKSKPHHPKKDQKDIPKPAATPRPEPTELPKGNLTSAKHPAAVSEVEISGPSSIFILAPPPSSLPFPSFALRPKLGCKAEAAAASRASNKDGLRRIQRLP